MHTAVKRPLIAALLLACAGVSSLNVRPAVAASLEDRVKELEKQVRQLAGETYPRSYRTRSETYTRPTKTAKACTSVRLRLDPGAKGFGTAHTWLTATIRYSGVSPSRSTKFDVYWGPSAAVSCGRAVPISNADGTADFKLYCSFDVARATPFYLRIWLRGSGDTCTGDHVDSLSATAKFTLIEIPKPPGHADRQ